MNDKREMFFHILRTEFNMFEELFKSEFDYDPILLEHERFIKLDGVYETLENSSFRLMDVVKHIDTEYYKFCDEDFGYRSPGGDWVLTLVDVLPTALFPKDGVDEFDYKVYQLKSSTESLFVMFSCDVRDDGHIFISNINAVQPVEFNKFFWVKPGTKEPCYRHMILDVTVKHHQLSPEKLYSGEEISSKVLHSIIQNGGFKTAEEWLKEISAKVMV